MKPLGLVVGVVFVVIAVAVPSWGQSDSAPKATGVFREGQRAPSLELPTIDGRSTINLASLAGRKAIVLQFASW